MTGSVALPSLGDGPIRVCFVCTGNICRSPMAEVVVRHLAAETVLPDATGTARPLADRLELSSAGTGPWHEGEPMDPRARTVLAARGYVDHGHVAHQFGGGAADTIPSDGFDLLVGMDRRHQQTLRSLTRGQVPDERIVLLRSFDRRAGGAVDVPDPYYGDEGEFAACLSLVEAGSHGLVAAFVAALTPPPA